MNPEEWMYAGPSYDDMIDRAAARIELLERRDDHAQVRTHHQRRVGAERRNSPQCAGRLQRSFTVHQRM